jgi:2-dehydropantoate 2-reductase
MKICVVGVGAIGGFIGTRLAAFGQCDVSAIARGTALAEMRAHGWRLHQAGQLIQAPAKVSDNPADLGKQDVVIVALKGPALASAAPTIAALMGPTTVVIPAMNGVPWWFGYGTSLEAEPAGAVLQSVDAGGYIASMIPVQRVLGCVVHASTRSDSPGVTRHVMGQGLILGEAVGGESTRATQIGSVLRGAGFDVTVSANVRYDIWYKLWGNLTMNPVSSITGATIDRLLADPLVRTFCSNAMQEAADIGRRIGCDIAQNPEDRHAITAKLGAFKTSMLQDTEAGRAIELDGIVTAVYEIARRLNVATPNIDALLGLTRLFGRVRGLYPLEAPQRFSS